jgi:hypothetical protein
LSAYERNCEPNLTVFRSLDGWSLLRAVTLSQSPVKKQTLKMSKNGAAAGTDRLISSLLLSLRWVCLSEVFYEYLCDRSFHLQDADLSTSRFTCPILSFNTQ